MRRLFEERILEMRDVLAYFWNVLCSAVNGLVEAAMAFDSMDYLIFVILVIVGIIMIL